jgi:hypothetical protein
MNLTQIANKIPAIELSPHLYKRDVSDLTISDKTTAKTADTILENIIRASSFSVRRNFLFAGMIFTPSNSNVYTFRYR